jgi:hypothetical protein
VSPYFAKLENASLVRPYRAGEDGELPGGLRYRPINLRHDGGETFGFRLMGRAGLFDEPCALAYAADLGSWDAPLVEALADVDLLALEFNHDVAMELDSGRDPRLIARVLGDDGHLSNDQATALLRAVLGCSPPGRLRWLVQLHLSRQCNRPRLALRTAAESLANLQVDVQIHTAAQDKTGRTIHCDGEPVRRRRSVSPIR